MPTKLTAKVSDVSPGVDKSGGGTAFVIWGAVALLFAQTSDMPKQEKREAKELLAELQA